MRARPNAGFTLIELMITIVIIAILVAIGYPSYRSWVVTSRRSDAHTLLTQAASDEERFYTLYNSYAPNVGAPSCTFGQACGLPPADAQSPEGYYTLAVAPMAGATISTSYLLTATPTSKGNQNLDTQCTTLTLDSTNQKGSTGTGSVQKCWNQ
ncbi:MAG: hypothetical protein B7Z66_11820 [Chromatiales bacterium 21-64-14]|nr:MAG: hypothetical protein B7Z66_11820 [Chromatiales bacterium 21-64-14]HQU16865.1 type IV pilin protein [Gammaproteobacteria bacterium]